MRPCPPVLLLIFNRPDLTRQVCAAVHRAQPAHLFVAADGPRPDRPGEDELCRAARAVIAEFDWPCRVTTLYRPANLGLKQAVSSAITWFFTHVEAGIILEDDCLPDASFFPFCAEMLDRYATHESVMMVSGDNYQYGHGGPAPYSYDFSVFAFIWGWATWRRAWQAYDSEMSQWANARTRQALRDYIADPAIYRHYAALFNQVYAGEINTWDYQWTYTCWQQRGLSITPAVNLVTNLGFDARGTHSTDTSSRLASLTAGALDFPLRHPPAVARNRVADRITFEQHMLTGREHRPGQVRTWLRQSLPPRLYRLFSLSYRRARDLADRVRSG